MGYRTKMIEGLNFRNEPVEDEWKEVLEVIRSLPAQDLSTILKVTMDSFSPRGEYPTLDYGWKKALQSIKDLPAEDRGIVLKTLVRYNQEAAKGSYQTEPDALIKLLQDKGLLDGYGQFVDLGAGSGRLIEELSVRCQQNMLGIDLSLGFVSNFNKRKKRGETKGTFMPMMEVGLIDRPLTGNSFRPGNRTTAISVITLDRLTYPKGLIENMAKCNRAKILATLLPIVPEDDNPSRQGEGKIVYTRSENRIVPGKDAEEDRKVLEDLLERTWRRPVDFAETDYVVSSSGDLQKYKLGVFFTS